MPKIIITGLRKLNTDQTLQANKDYGIIIIASLIGKFIPESFDDKQDEQTYYLQCDRIDTLFDLKDHKQIEVKKGKLSKSQTIRLIVEDELGKSEYDFFQDWIISQLHSLIEEYRENISK